MTQSFWQRLPILFENQSFRPRFLLLMGHSLRTVRKNLYHTRSWHLWPWSCMEQTSKMRQTIHHKLVCQFHNYWHIIVWSIIKKQQSRHIEGRETPLPLFLGAVIHSKTRSRDLVDILFRLGLPVSYDRVLGMLSVICSLKIKKKRM